MKAKEIEARQGINFKALVLKKTKNGYKSI